jgi:hypothetical protein
MKKLALFLAFCFSAIMCETATAQVSLRVNIATQPIWGPVGYDHVEYYYLPDIDSYYYVPQHRYIYMEGGRWISRSSLPQRYRNYDMYNSRKVVINDARPYLRNREYRERYGRSTERSNQESIRDSRDSRYFINKNHPEHSKWRNSNRNQGNRSQRDERRNNSQR